MELFLESVEYQTMKTKYQVEHFKLFGKYCKYNGNTISEKSATEMSEFFKNKKITIDYIENQTTKRGTTISTTKELANFFIKYGLKTQICLSMKRFFLTVICLK